MTWVTGLILGRYNAIKPADKAQKAQIQHKKKQIAIICAICCFGLLYAMKYWNFTLELLPSRSAITFPDGILSCRSVYRFSFSSP